MTTPRNRVINLLKAIKANDAKTVREMLSKNPELIKGEKLLRLPLWSAAAFGHPEIVEILISYGADASEKKQFGNIDLSKWYTLLHWMAYETMPSNENHIKVGEVLIRHGTDVNAYDYEDKTPVQYAIQKGNTVWAEFLLKNGAKLENLNWNPKSLVFHIFKRSNLDSRKDMLTLLFKFGLDPNFKNEGGKNLLHIFIQNYARNHFPEDLEVVKVLIKSGVLVNNKNNKKFSPLHCAILNNNCELVSLLIEKGANIKQRNNWGATPFLLAVRHRFTYWIPNYDMVELFLSYNVNINATCFQGKTALHFACWHFDDPMISLLLQKGANISPVCDEGRTPFSELQSYNFKDNTDKCILIMIKEFAKLYFDNVPISVKDMKLIQEDSMMLEFFEKCVTELNQMACTKFYGLNLYYSVLKTPSNIKKLAHLTKNQEFLAVFVKSLKNILCYWSDLQEILEEAIKVKAELEVAESRLNYIFGSLFPDTVIRKLADNMSLEDLPE